MTRKQKTQAEVIEALKKSGGIISDAAKLLELSSSTSLRERIKNDQNLTDAMNEIREDTKDLAEGNIISALKSGDKDVSKWYLASLAKDRGFGNKLEVEGRLQLQPPVDLTNLSLEELKQLEAIGKKVSSNSPTD
jgi:hypothetical protein